MKNTARRRFIGGGRVKASYQTLLVSYSR